MTPTITGIKGQIIKAEGNKPLEEVIEYITEHTQREEQDDGFYVMDVKRTIYLYEQWCRLMPRVMPFYAIKCNPDPVLVRQLHLLGTGFDCASKAEIEQVLSIGAKTSDIIYANPFKKLSHLRFAVQQNVSMMNFDRKEELIKIKQICPEAKLLIRFAPEVKGSQYEFVNDKFGAPIKDCTSLLAAAKDLGLNVVGVCFHVGTCCFNMDCYVHAVETSRQIFDEAEKIGYSFDILDIGGGFPGNDTKEDDELFSKGCKTINECLDQHFPVSSGVRIIAEPGTYFACSPFTLITNIYSVSETTKMQLEKIKNDEETKLVDDAQKGYMYFVDDGIYESFMFRLFTETEVFHPKPLKKKGEINHPSLIWGQTLDGNDVINKYCFLPKMCVGDWLYFPNLGAYSSSVSSNFNGFGSKYTYYIISSQTCQRMGWKHEDFDADVLHI